MTLFLPIQMMGGVDKCLHKAMFMHIVTGVLQLSTAATQWHFHTLIVQQTLINNR